MDLLKIVDSLQDLMYEIVVWVLLLPKTLFRAVFRPDLMVEYVNKEWEKESAKQFDDYLAPALFFLIVAVVPSAAITWMMGNFSILNISLSEQDLLVGTLATLISIVIYLIWLEWLNKRPLRRSGLKRLFFIQCYLVTPAQFIYVLLSFFATKSLGIYTVALIGTLLLIFYETFAFKDELKVNWWKGLWYAALPYLVFFVVVVLVMAVLNFIS